MMKILFQGDSITDAARDYNYDPHIGLGYPLLVKAQLGFENPGEYEFINRGISGNRIVDIYARLKRDIINLKPDVMSILVGVNDVCHDLGDKPNGVDAEKYYKIYDMLISEIKAELPHLKIMIMEPFLLKAKKIEEDWEVLSTEVKKRAENARKIAKKYDLYFIPLQDGFNKLSESCCADYWSGDGIHPTSMGHEYIKNEWIKAFRKI